MGELGLAFSDGGVERRSGFGLGWRSSAPPPDPSSLSEECLSVAEESAQKVLNCIHPTLDSEEKRRDIIDYLQRLIKNYLNCEVFPYGSVPLKTYLPDGDIDLTVIKSPNTTDESLAHDVLALLEREERYKNGEFIVKDTQYIDAEVKLVKCLVRGIVIDISFNQLGGLSTLCFLEQVDRLVGRNHLFKHSIILVKAWCYYESRILGAHHGLISTYALETLVLYIFNLFHSSLCNSPLEVLYRFLVYYSQFDWDNYCISLKGPVYKSSLPDIVVKMPESGFTDLMLSNEFLENCMEMFSVSLRSLEGKPKTFQPKYLNIIDPLKENNNLGRSVHIGNFYRIRNAFKYGARKLGQVLSQPTDKIADGIREFFANTIARHANEYKNSIQHSVLGFNDEDSLTASLSSPIELLSEDGMLLNSSISDVYNDSGELEFQNDRELSSEMGFEGFYSEEGVISGHYFAGDADNLATSNSSLRNGTSDCAPSSNCSITLSSNDCPKPFSLTSKFSAEIGISETGNLLQSYLVDNASQKYGSYSCLQDRKENREVNVDNISLDFRDVELTSVGGESEAFNALADLSGDYDSHIRSLLYGQLGHGFSLSGAHYPQPVPSRTDKRKPWDIVRQSVPFWQSQFSRMSFHPKKMPMEQGMCFAADSASPTFAFQLEGTQRARGIGTYFPHVNGFHRERPLEGRSRNKLSDSHDQFHRDLRSNGSYPSSALENNLENGSHEVLPAKSKSQGGGRLDARCYSSRSVGNGNQTNGGLQGLSKIEFGSIGNLTNEFSTSADLTGSTLCASPKKQGAAAARKKERDAGQSIHLKNEVEFPPLCQRMD